MWPTKPACNRATGACSPTSCSTPGDCDSLAPVCQLPGTSSAVCVGCSSDYDCAYWADTVCSPNDGTCVTPACSDESLCPLDTPHCDKPGQYDASCTGCADDSDCYRLIGSTCSTIGGTAGTCVPPLCAASCPSSSPRCVVDDTTGVATCGSCESHSDCASFLDTVVCASPNNTGSNTSVSLGSCVSGCLSSVDCNDPTLPWCDTTFNQCVACLVSGDCFRASQLAPICSAGTCKKCTTDKECADNFPLWPACHTELTDSVQVIGVCVQDTYRKGFSVAAIVLGSIGVCGVVAAIVLAVVLGAPKS